MRDVLPSLHVFSWAYHQTRSTERAEVLEAGRHEIDLRGEINRHILHWLGQFVLFESKGYDGCNYHFPLLQLMLIY